MPRRREEPITPEEAKAAQQVADAIFYPVINLNKYVDQVTKCSKRLIHQQEFVGITSYQDMPGPISIHEVMQIDIEFFEGSPYEDLNLLQLALDKSRPVRFKNSSTDWWVTHIDYTYQTQDFNQSQWSSNYSCSFSAGATHRTEANKITRMILGVAQTQRIM